MTLPNIENTFIEAAMHYLKEEADKLVKEYNKQMEQLLKTEMPIEESDKDPKKATLMKIHASVYDSLLIVLQTEIKKYGSYQSIKDSDLLITFKSSVMERLQRFKEKNYEASQRFCEGIIRLLKGTNVETLKLKYLSEAKGPAKNDVFKSYQDSIPGPPSGLVIVNVQFDSILLKWSKPLVNSEIVENYAICYHLVDLVNNEKYPDKTVPKNIFSIKVFPLLPNRVYKISVCAVSATKQQGEYASVFRRTEAGKPLKPPKPIILYDDFSSNHVHILMRAPKVDDPIHCGSPIRWATFRVQSPSNIELAKAEAHLTGIEKYVTAILKMKDDKAESKEYVVQVQVYNDEGASAWSNQSILKSAHLIPGPPHDHTVMAESTKITVRWNKPVSFRSSLSHYCVTLNNETKKETKREEIVFDNLEPFTNYKFSLWSVNEYGRKSAPVLFSAKTYLTVPAAPKKPRVDFVSQYNCVQVTFISPHCYERKPCKAEVEIASKILTVRSGLLNNKEVVVKNIDLDEFSITEGNKTCRVRVYNSEGPSEWSEPVYISVSSLTPLEPSFVGWSNAISKGIQIRWKPPRKLLSIVNHYEIRLRSTDNSRQQQVYDEISKGESSFTILDLRPNTEYNCDVYAVNEAGKKRGKFFKVKTKAIPPEKPENPAIRIIESADERHHHVTATIKIPTLEKCNWSEVKELELATESDSQKSLITEELVLPRLKQIYEFDISLDHAGCHIYVFKVRFRNEGGWSEYSDVNGDATIHVRELFAGQPQAAQGVCSSREIDVTWSEPKKNPESVDHYLLAISGKGAEKHEQVRVGRSQRLARFTDLVPNNDYEITIIAVTGSNYATFPTKLKVCTKAAAPNKPVVENFLWSGPDFDNTVVIEIPRPKDEDCNGRPVVVISVSIEALFTILGASVPLNIIKTRKEFDVDWFDEIAELIFFDLPNCPLVEQLEMGSKLSYSVKLAFINGIGCSDYSESVKFYARQLLPGEPKNVEVIGVSSSKFKLSWEPPTRNPYSVEDYKLCVIEKKSLKEKIFQLPAKATSATIYNVEPSMKYDMQLCARNFKQIMSDPGRTEATTKCSAAMRRALTASTGILGSLAAPITSTALLVKKAKKYYNENEAEKALLVGMLAPVVVPASIILPPASGIIAAVDVHQQLSSMGNLESSELEFDFKAKEPAKQDTNAAATDKCVKKGSTVNSIEANEEMKRSKSDTCSENSGISELLSSIEQSDEARKRETYGSSESSGISELLSSIEQSDEARKRETYGSSESSGISELLSSIEQSEEVRRRETHGSSESSGISELLSSIEQSEEARRCETHGSSEGSGISALQSSIEQSTGVKKCEANDFSERSDAAKLGSIEQSARDKHLNFEEEEKVISGGTTGHCELAQNEYLMEDGTSANQGELSDDHAEKNFSTGKEKRDEVGPVVNSSDMPIDVNVSKVQEKVNNSKQFVDHKTSESVNGIYTQNCEDVHLTEQEVSEMGSHAELNIHEFKVVPVSQYKEAIIIDEASQGTESELSEATEEIKQQCKDKNDEYAEQGQIFQSEDQPPKQSEKTKRVKSFEQQREKDSLSEDVVKSKDADNIGEAQKLHSTEQGTDKKDCPVHPVEQPEAETVNFWRKSEDLYHPQQWEYREPVITEQSNAIRPVIPTEESKSAKISASVNFIEQHDESKQVKKELEIVEDKENEEADPSDSGLKENEEADLSEPGLKVASEESSKSSEDALKNKKWFIEVIKNL